MARVNVDTLGIRELKWTGMGEFSSDDHYIFYCGQESFRRNGVAIIVNKTVLNAVRGCNLKNDRMISVRFQGKPFNITVIQVYAWTSNAEEADVEQFYEDLQDLLELTPKKDVLFITGNWNAKVGSQETSGITGKLDITRWSILKSDWLYSLQPKMEKLYTFRKNKTGSWLWLRSWTIYCKIQT